MPQNVTKKHSPALILGLAAGKPVRAIAAEIGISERQVFRRLKDPSLVQAVAAARAEIISTAVAQLSALMAAAVEALEALLRADSEQVRLGACRAVLELGTRLRESEELERRIGELESRLKGEVDGAAGSVGAD